MFCYRCTYESKLDEEIQTETIFCKDEETCNKVADFKRKLHNAYGNNVLFSDVFKADESTLKSVLIEENNIFDWQEDHELLTEDEAAKVKKVLRDAEGE